MKEKRKELKELYTGKIKHENAKKYFWLYKFIIINTIQLI